MIPIKPALSNACGAVEVSDQPNRVPLGTLSDSLNGFHSWKTPWTESMRRMLNVVSPGLGGIKLNMIPFDGCYLCLMSITNIAWTVSAMQ
jgi:hypothetical protein